MGITNETKVIKSYSYSLNNDILEIYITDLDNNEFLLATLCDCDNMADWELDNLAQEILEEKEYYIYE